jgi:hypothetical protein
MRETTGRCPLAMYLIWDRQRTNRANCGQTRLGRPSSWRYACIFLVLLTVGVSSCGYLPGRKTYWDDKILTLCSKEGRVEIFESVFLTREQAELLPRIEGKLTTRPRTPQWASDPVYSERTITSLNDDNPRVTREEVAVIRAVDQKVVARWVEFARVGGDIPTGIAHPSSFRCPDPRQRLEELQRLFVVRGD